MITKFRWFAHQLFQKLWVIAVAFALLGLMTAFLAAFVGRLLPDGLADKFGADAVAPILTILATTLLTVVTFSLSVMVQALANASSSVTPRVTKLLSVDRTTQRVLSIFLGGFIFSLIGLIALQGGLYSKNERLVLFAVTVFVVITVVVAMIRWIQHLTVFGLMTDSIGKVETSAREAIQTRVKDPSLGAHMHEGGPPPGTWAVTGPAVGYVRHVDLEALQDWAKETDARVFVTAMPGTFVHGAAPLAHVEGGAGAGFDDVRNAFSIDDTRSFDQDPRFGLCVLAEIAQRALSPAVNDPGTAIDILTRAVRLLALWRTPGEEDLRFSRVHVPPLLMADMMADVFPAIARDGAKIYSVQIRLQKMLLALVEMSPEVFGPGAWRQSQDALARAASGDNLPGEMDSIRRVARAVATTANPGGGMAL